VVSDRTCDLCPTCEGCRKGHVHCRPCRCQFAKTELDLEYTPTITPISQPTRDTPEAVEIAPLPPANRSLMGSADDDAIRLCRHREITGDDARHEWACVRCGRPFIPALDGWTLVNEERLAIALHYAMCDVSHHDGGPMGHDCHSWPKYPAIARTAMRALVVEP
jgi:hypothetical protein